MEELMSRDLPAGNEVTSRLKQLRNWCWHKRHRLRKSEEYTHTLGGSEDHPSGGQPYPYPEGSWVVK